MGSTFTSAGLGTLPETERIVVVGENSRNVGVMTDALTGFEVRAATSPEQLNPVLSGSLPAELVVVDTHTVSDDVAALVETVLDRGLSVVLLANESSPTVRRDAAGTEGLRFRQKPVRSAALRSVVKETRN